MVTRLWLCTLAQMLMVSPGTYPPRSNLTRHDTGPWVMHVIPSICSISQWKGCCEIGYCKSFMDLCDSCSHNTVKELMIKNRYFLYIKSVNQLLNIIKQYLIPKNKITVIIKAVDTFPISTSLLSTHSKNRRFKIKVNRIHNNEDLLVLVGEAIRFS